MYGSHNFSGMRTFRRVFSVNSAYTPTQFVIEEQSGGKKGRADTQEEKKTIERKERERERERERVCV